MSPEPSTETAREFLVTRQEWRAAMARAKTLNAYRQRPVGRWPYVWGVKGPRLLLRWYDYAMGRITSEEAGNGRFRCTLLILGCTGEIKNPAAYARLKGQFFSELLAEPMGREGRR
jgi:hypothetical protein